MDQNNKELEVTLNEQSLEILITKLIPTSQYFERSFEMLQKQMDEFRAGQQDLKADINRRLEPSSYCTSFHEKFIFFKFKINTLICLFNLRLSMVP